MIRPNSQKIEVAKPQISPYGILSPAVKVVNVDSDWWLGGAIHEIYDAGISYSVVADQGFDPGDIIREMTNPELGEARFAHVVPVTIETRLNVSTMGTDLSELQRMAEDAMDLVSQKAIEEAFWKYLGSKFRSLPNTTDGGDDEVIRTPLVPGTVLSPRNAQAVLEGAVAENTVGYQATLHFPRLATSNLEVHDEDGALKTVLGSYVIAGSGYGNTDQDGNIIAPQGNRVAYATGPVTVLLGNAVVLPDINQRVNTNNNVAEIFVQKPALIAFSTKDVFSVLVDTAQVF